MRNQNLMLFRIQLLFFGIISFAFFIIFRLYVVQVVHSQNLRQQADKQYYREQPHIFNRGSIFFKNKDGSLLPAAVQKTGFSVSLNPSSISDPEFVYNELSKILDFDKELFMKKAESGAIYQEIAVRLPLETAESVRTLNLKGVDINEQKWRFYPAGNLASHVLGIVAYDENELAGRYGLERYYEDVLERNNKASFVNFFAEVFANMADSVGSKKEQSQMGDIITTIEPQVQAFLEKKLKSLNDEWNAQYSGGIIIDPNTGEIRAMAVLPSFDPNNFESEKLSTFSNPIVEKVYEMGSTVKALTMAAGLDYGVVTAQTTYFDAGTLVLNNWRISNFDGKGRGTVNMQGVLNNSLNTGAVFVVQQMGNKNFAQYMEDYGLTGESGIDLPYEASNLVQNLKSSRDLEYATASFGQGIAFTPIAMVRALSVLANGGILINPHLVSQIKFENGELRETAYDYDEQEKRVLKKEIAEEISRMLTNTVDVALLEGKVKMENYSIAAKTGTAQIAKESERGYYENKFFHTFFGYFPSFDSKFLVFLFSYNPRARYASETLTYPFMDITKFLINYYAIPPDR